MPISPEKQKLYPGGSLRSKEWQAIREQVRARSGDKCEQCGLENGSMVLRSVCGMFHFVEGLQFSNVGWICDSDTGAKDKHVHLMDTPSDQWRDAAVEVVLTVAHLHENDEATTNIDRLRHWCQRCHNKFDAKMRAVNARKTREKKTGQTNLFTHVQ